MSTSSPKQIKSPQFTIYYLNNNPVVHHSKVHSHQQYHTFKSAQNIQNSIMSNRKYQNMIFIMRKINQCTDSNIKLAKKDKNGKIGHKGQQNIKDGQQNNHNGSSNYTNKFQHFGCKKSHTYMQNQKQNKKYQYNPKQPYLINKFIRSKRLMVTSTLHSQLSPQKYQNIRDRSKNKLQHEKKILSNRQNNHSANKTHLHTHSITSIKQKNKQQYNKIYNRCRQRNKLIRFFSKTAICSNQYNPFELPKFTIQRTPRDSAAVASDQQRKSIQQNKQKTKNQKSINKV